MTRLSLTTTLQHAEKDHGFGEHEQAHASLTEICAVDVTPENDMRGFGNSTVNSSWDARLLPLSGIINEKVQLRTLNGYDVEASPTLTTTITTPHHPNFSIPVKRGRIAKMLMYTLITAAALLLVANAQYGRRPNAGADVDGKYTLVSRGIRAQFIPYGASITNLFVKDKNGVERDVVLGWDNATYYTLDQSHPHLGGVPGRYANRIKNASFEIDGTTYRVLANENGGLNQLHGGPNGWDYRNWTVTEYEEDSITFSLLDKDGDQGFPGDVVSYVTYTVTPYAWHFKMTATAKTKKTPIMLSSHTYWNLDGFQNPSTPTALNHTLSLPYSGQRIGVDGILIPNGTILPNLKGSVNDFWSKPKQIGADFHNPEIQGNCGTGCAGYDTAYLVNRAQNGPYDWRTGVPVATLSSDFTGIQVDTFTDQDAFQIYTCSGQAGTQALKKTQGFFNDTSRPRVVPKFGCVVMEVEDWIDGINQPEWGRQKKQIFGPGDEPYVLQGYHAFSIKGKK